jgi:glycosyltransferase involved in cell wall biosynthesis
MHIGIDVRYLSHGLVGGVHHYLAQLLPALVQFAPDHTFVLYADRCRPFEMTALPQHVTVRMMPWRSPLSSMVNDLTMPRWMAADQLDMAHFPANYGFAPAGVPKIVTLHDAINILPLREILRGHPKKPRTMLMMTYLHFCTVASLRTTTLVLTVSEDAAKRIRDIAHMDRKNVRVIFHGVDRSWGRVDDPVLLADAQIRFGLSRPFLLADAIKNPGALLQAWSMLPESARRDREIIFFSRSHEVSTVLKTAVQEGRARVFFQLLRPDLNALFSLADAFVFPSWIEGFGLPVLEAMACGTPVIATDRGSIPEVTGDAALLSDVNDPSALAEHICQVLTSPGIARQLRLRGQARASLFTWERAAQATLASYAAAVEAGVRRVRTESAA